MSEDDDDILLPPAADRERLLDAFADLVKRHGPAPLLRAPLLEPVEAYFPDPWSANAAGVRRLVRRLCAYAGLPARTVKVTIEDDGGGTGALGGSFAPVWCSHVDADSVTIHAAASVLRSPLVVVPATARAVAEAWTMAHEGRALDDAATQRRVDVVAVYLGFGLLTVDASTRHHSAQSLGLPRGRVRTQLGVLPGPAIAFLLAAQLVARRMAEGARRKRVRSLRDNPAAFVQASLAALPDAEALATRLRLPAPEAWPPAVDLSRLVAPLPEVAEEPTHVDEDKAATEIERGVVGMNEGRRVFRVERSKATRLARLLALPIVLLGMLAGRMQMGIEIPMWQVLVAAGSLGLLGLAVGRMLPDRRCSEPRCGTALAPEDKVCPRCGGTIAGVIAHPRDRLAAEEALAREETETPPSP